jgi:hypothetical protein
LLSCAFSCINPNLIYSTLRATKNNNLIAHFNLLGKKKKKKTTFEYIKKILTCVASRPSFFERDRIWFDPSLFIPICTEMGIRH